MPRWNDVGEIDQHYAKLVKDAGDDNDRVVELRAQHREDKALFRELSAARREALSEFPLAKGFESLLHGDTPEDIRTAAEAVHKQAEALRGGVSGGGGGGQPPTPADQARDLYGGSAAGGGQPGPVNPLATGDPKTDADTAFLEDYVRKFNGGEPISPTMTNNFERIREGRAWAESIAERGKFGLRMDQLPWTPEARQARTRAAS